MLQHASLEVPPDRIRDCVAFWALLGLVLLGRQKMGRTGWWWTGLILMIALNVVFGPRSYARAMRQQDGALNAPRDMRRTRRADRSSATLDTGGGNARRSPLP